MYNIYALEYGGFGSVGGKIETDIKINHEGEVNRYCCWGILATIQCVIPYCTHLHEQSSLYASEPLHHSHKDSVVRCASIWLFKAPIKTRYVLGVVIVQSDWRFSGIFFVRLDSSGECRPELRLKGHSKEGYVFVPLTVEDAFSSLSLYHLSLTLSLSYTHSYGLSWNSHSKGHLLSASDDEVSHTHHIQCPYSRGSWNLQLAYAKGGCKGNRGEDWNDTFVGNPWYYWSGWLSLKAQHSYLSRLRS